MEILTVKTCAQYLWGKPWREWRQIRMSQIAKNSSATHDMCTLWRTEQPWYIHSTLLFLQLIRTMNETVPFTSWLKYQQILCWHTKQNKTMQEQGHISKMIKCNKWKHWTWMTTLQEYMNCPIPRCLPEFTTNCNSFSHSFSVLAFTLYLSPIEL